MAGRSEPRQGAAIARTAARDLGQAFLHRLAEQWHSVDLPRCQQGLPVGEVAVCRRVTQPGCPLNIS